MIAFVTHLLTSLPWLVEGVVLSVFDPWQIESWLVVPFAPRRLRTKNKGTAYIWIPRRLHWLKLPYVCQCDFPAYLIRATNIEKQGY